jgi:hypothetical protein
MKRKSAHQELVEQADSWCKALVLHRQGVPCLRAAYTHTRCGGPIQGAHILRKGGKYISIRHDTDNVIGLCRNHHMFWAHTNELEFYEWIEEIFPGRIAELRERARFRSGRVDLKLLICVLKSQYERETRKPAGRPPFDRSTPPGTHKTREAGPSTQPTSSAGSLGDALPTTSTPPRSQPSDPESQPAAPEAQR